jgi:predicted DNA-binding transcriptional regulator YafY
MRGDQLIRQWKLVDLLSGKYGRTFNQLSAELGVTKRTVQRDIQVLEVSGFPIFSETRDGILYWRLVDARKEAADLAFTMPELMALYFSRDLLQVLHGSPLQDAMQSAINKIGARLPASGHNLVRRLKEQTAVSVTGWKDYSQSFETINALSRAIRQHLTIQLSYKRLQAAEARSRSVDPYRLWYAGGGLYLIAYDHSGRGVRTYAVERIRSVTNTSLRFTVHDEFDFEEFIKTAFPVHGGKPQQVRIRFSPDQAPYVMERHWHDSQKLHPQDDGSVILELQVGNLWEVKRWLIGWGADAEPIAPQELVDEIRAEIVRLNRMRNGNRDPGRE